MIDLGALLEGTGYEHLFKRQSRPGDGARFAYFPEAKNGHIIGYTTKADDRGKWYAVEYIPYGTGARSGRGKAAHWKLYRLVKCATRTKAKAKACDWLNDADGYPRVKAATA